MRLRARGFSLVELTLVLGIIGVLIAAVLPYFTSIHKVWDAFGQQSEHLQNSRVALDYFQKEVKQAARINTLTGPGDPNGILAFEKSDGTVIQLFVDTSGTDAMFSLQESGVTHEIAGPVSSVIFTGFDDDGVATSVNAKVKSIEMSLTMEGNNVANRTYTSMVTLPKDIVESLYYGVFADGNVSLSGSGSISGDIHANGTFSDSGSSIVVSGDTTDYLLSSSVTPASVSINQLISQFQTLSTYEAIPGAIIITSNYVFNAGSYSGMYYFGDGANVQINSDVDITGSVIAEGNVDLLGANISISPSSNMPAIVSGQDVSIVASPVDLGGTVFGDNNLSISSTTFNGTGNGAFGIAAAAGQTVYISCFTGVFNGAVVAGDDVRISLFYDISIIGPPTIPAVVSGDETLFNFLGFSISVDGICYSGGNFTDAAPLTTIAGSIVAKGDVSLGAAISLTYTSDYLKNPPVYIWE